MKAEDFLPYKSDADLRLEKAVNGIRTKINLILEGQQQLTQQLESFRSEIVLQAHATRTLAMIHHSLLNERIDRHEQRHHT